MMSARCLRSSKGDKGPLSFDDLFGDEKRDVFEAAAEFFIQSEVEFCLGDCVMDPSVGVLLSA